MSNKGNGETAGIVEIIKKIMETDSDGYQVIVENFSNIGYSNLVSAMIESGIHEADIDHDKLVTEMRKIPFYLNFDEVVTKIIEAGKHPKDEYVANSLGKKNVEAFKSSQKIFEHDRRADILPSIIHQYLTALLVKEMELSVPVALNHDVLEDHLLSYYRGLNSDRFLFSIMIPSLIYSYLNTDEFKEHFRSVLNKTTKNFAKKNLEDKASDELVTINTYETLKKSIISYDSIKEAEKLSFFKRLGVAWDLIKKNTNKIEDKSESNKDIYGLFENSDLSVELKNGLVDHLVGIKSNYLESLLNFELPLEEVLLQVSDPKLISGYFGFNLQKQKSKTFVNYFKEQLKSFADNLGIDVLHHVIRLTNWHELSFKTGIELYEFANVKFVDQNNKTDLDYALDKEMEFFHDLTIPLKEHEKAEDKKYIGENREKYLEYLETEDDVLTNKLTRYQEFYDYNMVREAKKVIKSLKETGDITAHFNNEFSFKYVKQGDRTNLTMTASNLNFEGQIIQIRKSQYAIDRNLIVLLDEVSDVDVPFSQYKRLLIRQMDEGKMFIEKAIREAEEQNDGRKKIIWERIDKQFSEEWKKKESNQSNENYDKENILEDYNDKRFELYEEYVSAIMNDAKNKYDSKSEDWTEKIEIELESRLKSHRRVKPFFYSVNDLYRTRLFLSSVHSIFDSGYVDEDILSGTMDLYIGTINDIYELGSEAKSRHSRSKETKEHETYRGIISILQNLDLDFYNLSIFKNQKEQKKK